MTTLGYTTNEMLSEVDKSAERRAGSAAFRHRQQVATVWAEQLMADAGIENEERSIWIESDHEIRKKFEIGKLVLVDPEYRDASKYAYTQLFARVLKSTQANHIWRHRLLRSSVETAVYGEKTFYRVERHLALPENTEDTIRIGDSSSDLRHYVSVDPDASPNAAADVETSLGLKAFTDDMVALADIQGVELTHPAYIYP